MALTGLSSMSNLSKSTISKREGMAKSLKCVSVLATKLCTKSARGPTLEYLTLHDRPCYQQTLLVEARAKRMSVQWQLRGSQEEQVRLWSTRVIFQAGGFNSFGSQDLTKFWNRSWITKLPDSFSLRGDNNEWPYWSQSWAIGPNSKFYLHSIALLCLHWHISLLSGRQKILLSGEQWSCMD